MRIFSIAFLAGLLAAQAPQTFVVDAANGPGTHFTEITAAAAAVPDGSILRVRPGVYAAVLIDGKGLTVLCEPGAVVGSGGSFAIQNTQPHQLVVVRGLGQGAASLSLWVANAAGPVVIDGAGSSITNLTWSLFVMAIVNSSQVAVRGYSITASGFVINNSTVVFEACQIVGGDGHVTPEGWVEPTPGLSVGNSDVQLVHTSVRGGNGAFYAFNRPGGAAVHLFQNSRLRVTGLASHSLAGGTSPLAGAAAAIGGDGTARVAPQIPMTGNPPVGPGVTLTRPAMPSLVSQDAAPGGTLVAHRYGAVGSVFVVALGLPGSAMSLPGIADPLWFDPAHFCIEAVGVGASGGPFVVQRPVPNQPGFSGVNLVWQSADLHANGTVELSNPSPTVIR